MNNLRFICVPQNDGGQFIIKWIIHMNNISLVSFRVADDWLKVRWLWLIILFEYILHIFYQAVFFFFFFSLCYSLLICSFAQSHPLASDNNHIGVMNAKEGGYCCSDRQERATTSLQHQITRTILIISSILEGAFLWQRSTRGQMTLLNK